MHPDEANYLAHTQGKRHQENLARRAAKDHFDKADQTVPINAATPSAPIRKTIKIGRPGYRVTKETDPETGQRSLLFEIDYPEIAPNVKPMFRFMSAYEQQIETPDRAYQYILFAAEPYETIGFKVPNLEIVKDVAKSIDEKNKLYSLWNEDKKVFLVFSYSFFYFFIASCIF